MNTVKITENKTSLWVVLGYGIAYVFISLMSIMLSLDVQARVGTIGGFGLGMIILLYVYLRGIRNYVELTGEEITIRAGNVKSVCGWDNVTKMGIQGIFVRRMGVVEVYSVLGISFRSAVPGIDTLRTGEFAFLRKKSDLQMYMHDKDKFDLYINLAANVEKNMAAIETFGTTVSPYVHDIPPLVKARDEAEYRSVHESKVVALMDQN